jgi:hypothetical protein
LALFTRLQIADKAPSLLLGIICPPPVAENDNEPTLTEPAK